MRSSAADGLWSVVRKRIGYGEPPRFAGRTAWRGLVPAREVAPEFREPLIHLWLGRDAHLVHYPVKAGRVINIVAITADSWNAPGWSEPASRADLIPRLAAENWAPPALSLVGLPEAWLKWALYDRRPLRRWSPGRGGASRRRRASDAAVFWRRAPPWRSRTRPWRRNAWRDSRTMPPARCAPIAPCGARAPEVQRLAARNGARYHLAGARARLRDAAMRMIGGQRLLQHYDWLYDWRPPAPFSLA